MVPAKLPDPPPAALASRGAGLHRCRAVNVTELFTALEALTGSHAAGGVGNGIVAARLVNGVEYARTAAIDEPKLRAAHRRRHGGGATPLVLLGDDPDTPGVLRVLGPQRDGPVRRVRSESMLSLIERAAQGNRLLAVRLIAEEVERLDTERIAGLKVRGLGTEHLYERRLPASPRWPELSDLVEGVSRAGWRELLNDLGYTIDQLSGQGCLAKAGGRPVAVVHPRASAAQFAKLDEAGRLPEGALVVACAAHGAPYGILAAGSRLRLLAAGPQAVGATTRYLELDASALEDEFAPLLGLLAPPYLADGRFADVLDDARDYGQRLRSRLDTVLRQEVLPVLGRELGAWASAEGDELADDSVRSELEAAALAFVFRVLFLLYAESAGTDVDRLRKGTRGDLFERIRARHRIEDRDGELVMLSEPARLGSDVFSFVQGLLEVSDLRNLDREVVKSTFKEDLEHLLTTAFAGRLTKGYVDAAHDRQRNYEIPYLLNGLSRPIAVFDIANDEHVSHALVIARQHQDWGARLHLVAVERDQTELSRRPVAWISDAFDKQFSTLAGNEAAITEYLDEQHAISQRLADVV